MMDLMTSSVTLILAIMENKLVLETEGVPTVFIDMYAKNILDLKEERKQLQLFS